MSTTTISGSAARAGVRTGARRDLHLLVRQIRYEQRSYWRNRGRSIFTFAFPLLYLIVFASLEKGQRASSVGGCTFPSSRLQSDRVTSSTRRLESRPSPFSVDPFAF